jgi:hypothetical protein
MILEGFKSCAPDTLEKNRLIRLKAATNKDLKLLDIIPSLKFAAKIRAEGQNMKIRLKKGVTPRQDRVSGIPAAGGAHKPLSII